MRNTKLLVRMSATKKRLKSVDKKAFLPEYSDNLKETASKERYIKKLELIDGCDPYKIPRIEWHGDVDLWPSISYINLGMYLLFSPSPYTQDQLENYKSLACYQNFVNGWVREVLVKQFGENRLVIGKVQAQLFCTGRAYCDFIVWSEKTMFIERILPDIIFWQTNVAKAKLFAVKGLMPELLARWYSRPTKQNKRPRME